jgi:hypothetical protein
VTATIAYDRPIKNLIDQLSATGHVTHTSYKKKSVTLHHNGGRLSHEGVLSVWRTRPASAHFDADKTGALAQYVKVNEYAWAVGNLKGNQETISIEMADETLGPDWTVADATWQSAARLAGWLFAKVIDGTPRPTKSNLFYHKHWSSTDCAGPYMDKIYAKVLKEAQKWYDYFKNKKTTPSSPSSSGSSTPKTINAIAKEVIAQKWGNGPERRRKLLQAGYNPDKVQAEVNRILQGDHAATGPKGRKTYQQVADEVYNGKWGNDPERSRRLKAAGYDPVTVQRQVNLLVKNKR